MKEREYEAMMGKRPPNMILAECRREADKYKEALQRWKDLLSFQLSFLIILQLSHIFDSLDNENMANSAKVNVFWNNFLRK